ncbi:lysosomal acid phosphatase-like [Microplitis mediator]|uniref:lysosomal acid phosphatase-like n=1 Tax=Microplitis mediator TaxID=375433 RepID=UPI002555F212|nr:lysosomal acid phosphatase-like [Microplitis mediator]
MNRRIEIFFFIIVIVNLNSFVNSANQEPSSSPLKLQYVAVVFRHGDRTPDKTEMFPNDPYKNHDFSPVGYGQLTNEGKQRVYKLGQLLRTLYNDLLGDLYNPKNLIARSTDYARTRMSLQLLLAGLFPPKESQVWNKNLIWQPVVTSYVARAEDFLLVPILCPRYIAELEKVKELPEIKNKIDIFLPLMRNLTLLTGKNISSPFDLLLLYNVLMAESSMGLPLDKWATEIFPHGLLLDGTVLDYEIKNSNENLKRLRGGMLLRNITDSMMGVINGSGNTDKIMTIFSGHDTNVASLLFIFGAYTPHMPEYSSSVMVELLNNSTDYYVRVRYYLGIPPTLKDIKIPGCDILCPFNKFMVLMENLIATDAEMMCTKNNYMEFKFLVYIFITNFIAGVISTDYELKFVTVIFRHGDRTPQDKEFYPNDPYLHDDFYPIGRGQLTVAGKRREYQLGQMLRDLYDDFLGDIYIPKDIVARSTDRDRTRMSLQLVVSAMYPPKGPQVWNDTLNWQPILTSYVPAADDTLLKPNDCPLYKEELERVLNSPELKSEIDRFHPLMENLTVVTGKEISTTKALASLFSGLTALKAMNRQLPEWSEGIFPEGLLFDASNLDYKSIFFNDNLKRLSGGMVLRNITDTMSDIVNGKLTNHQKMNIFSAHDANVASLLAIVSDLDAHIPKYSASVMVELLQKKENYYVKARYYRGIPATVVDLKIPGCDTVCPFNDFMTLMKNFIPSDEEVKCDKK